MKTINKIYNKTLEIKHSKFMAYLVPFSQFREQLEFLKEQHPKARHFVTASRMLNEYDQIVESSSDDGEPKGTSGKPTLAVLQGNDLMNVAVIIVRYFGGTKLGTGGLVRAYSDATNSVIAQAQLLEYVKKLEFTITTSYHNMNKVEYLIEQNGIEVSEKEFTHSGVTLKLLTTQEVYKKFFQECERLLEVF